MSSKRATCGGLFVDGRAERCCGRHQAGGEEPTPRPSCCAAGTSVFRSGSSSQTRREGQQLTVYTRVSRAPRRPPTPTSTASSSVLLSPELHPIAVRPRTNYPHHSRHITTSRNVQDPFLGRFRCAQIHYQKGGKAQRLMIYYRYRRPRLATRH